MIISETDAIIAADKFINYFKNFSNLEDYLRHVKKSVIYYTNEIGDHKDDFLNINLSLNDYTNEIVRSYKEISKKEFIINLERYKNPSCL